jgi:hypothetical protein
MPRRPPPCSVRPGVVALLTDFGQEGHHAGVLRAVILGGNPAARPVDLSHGIPAGDVVLGAWTLRWSWRWFPPGTVHCAVVDPGVGTPRRAIAAAAGGQFFVGPDNGLLSYALANAGRPAVVALSLPAAGSDPSATFHGRDVFAPAAARLSLGATLESLGGPITDWIRLDEPIAQRSAPGEFEGEVVAVDRWGNLVTSLTADLLPQRGINDNTRVRLGRRLIRGVRRTYAEVPRGTLTALINSNGHLEIAVNGGRADAVTRAGRGAIVRVRS